MLFIFTLLVFISNVCSRHVGELLCRECGSSITRQSELINITDVNEHFLKYKYDFPLVGKNTTILVLENPSKNYFHVAGARSAHLRFLGGPFSEDSWFPNMQWTNCVCKSCGKHMGWYFEPEAPTTPAKDQKSFVGLVLDNLISSDYVDTLTKTPL